MQQLFGFGRPILSEVAIPGTLSDTAAEPASSVLTITLAPVTANTTDPIYHRDGEALVYAPPGVGRYHCAPGSIEISPDPGGDTQALTDLLIATALPAVEWLRGRFMLHAAAVVLPGTARALAISGVSGSGKSTVAAALLGRGAKLLADDSISLGAPRGEWLAAGLPGGLFQCDASPAGRSFHPVPRERSVGQAALGAIVVLGERANASSIRRLAGPDAVARLIVMQHRPRVPAFLDRRGDVLRQAVALAAAVPVWLWSRRAGTTGLDEAEWRQLVRFVASGEQC